MWLTWMSLKLKPVTCSRSLSSRWFTVKIFNILYCFRTISLITFLFKEIFVFPVSGWFWRCSVAIATLCDRISFCLFCWHRFPIGSKCRSSLQLPLQMQAWHLSAGCVSFWGQEAISPAGVLCICVCHLCSIVCFCVWVYSCCFPAFSWDKSAASAFCCPMECTDDVLHRV